ncbi:IS630 family transposase [Deinococcus sonorensis]
MKLRYAVYLDDEQRDALKRLLSAGKTHARRLTHARILLAADKNGPAHSDQEIVEFLHVSDNTAFRVRKRFVEGGLEHALNHMHPQHLKPHTLSPEAEAHLIALACTPEKGQSRMSLRLLADKMVELGHVETVSHETVRKAPEKNALKPHLKEQWVIPPLQNAAFVAAMEDVLDLYARPYNAFFPVVCFDERPCQLIDDVMTPLPLKPGQPERFDDEYVRNGTANVFGMLEPLTGRRWLRVTEQRTKRDFAHAIKHVVNVLYPEAVLIRVVLDNLNTHSLAALYETFPAAEARCLAKKLEFHFTPKRGSWLNAVEIEFAALSKQCLDRRIGRIERLREEVEAWCERRNARGVKVEWRFTTEVARTKLDHLYPSNQN